LSLARGDSLTWLSRGSVSFNYKGRKNDVIEPERGGATISSPESGRPLYLFRKEGEEKEKGVAATD